MTMFEVNTSLFYGKILKKLINFLINFKIKLQNGTTIMHSIILIQFASNTVNSLNIEHGN